MIFHGCSGSRAALLESIDGTEYIQNWQFKEGLYHSLSFSSRQINHLSTDRSVLDDSTFSESILKDCEFLRSNLQNVVFSGCELYRTVFKSCQLRQSCWRNLMLEEVCIQGCAAPRIQMEQINLSGGHFMELEANRAMFRSLCVTRSSFRAEHSSGITGFKNSEFMNCFFINSCFTGNIFSSSLLENCVFIACHFSCIDWSAVSYWKCFFFQCHGAPPSTGVFTEEDVRNMNESFLNKQSWDEFEKEYLYG